MFWFDGDYTSVRASIVAMTSCVAGFCILGVWAGLSHRHWFVRALVVALAIAAMAPVRAYEPMLLFLIVVPATAMAMAAIQRLFRNELVSRHVMEADRSMAKKTGMRTIILAGIYLVPPLGLSALMAHAWNQDHPGWQYWFTWYEWAAFPVLVCALAVTTMLPVKTPRTSATHPSNAPSPVAGRFGRFGLRDLLLGTVVLAIISAGLAPSIGQPLFVNWLSMLGIAACLVIVSATAASVVLVRRFFVIPLIILPLAIMASILLQFVFVDDGINRRFISTIDELSSEVMFFSFYLFCLASAVISFTYLLLVAGTLDAPVPHAARCDRGKTVARVALISACLALFGPLVVVYARMTAEVPELVQELPDTNAYPQIIAAIERWQRLNPSEWTVSEFRELSLDPSQGDEIAEIYEELMESLEQPAYVSFDWEAEVVDEISAEQMLELQTLRGLVRTWEREAGGLSGKRDFDRAADFCLASMQLGGTQQKGGVLLQALFGIAIEGLGVDQLSRLRMDLSVDYTRRLLESLNAFGSDREPGHVTVAREASRVHHGYRWWNSLAREAPRVLALRAPDRSDVSWLLLPGVRAFEDARKRCEATLRLLITDLAIRLFQHDHKRLPASLDELTPHYLPAVPTDPFSNGPLVYRPAENAFVLYSVWQDGQDDGGNFGTSKEIYESSGFDLDLDAHARMKTAPAAANANP